jgi:hypothetical protein
MQNVMAGPTEHCGAARVHVAERIAEALGVAAVAAIALITRGCT